MKNEVRYIDGGGQRVHGLYSEAESLPPDEMVMAMEEGVEEGRVILLGEVLDYCFADGHPEDWRWAGRRFAWLVGLFFPQEAAMMAALAGYPGAAKVCFPMRDMQGLHHDEHSLRRLVLWLCGNDPRDAGRRERAFRLAIARVYLLGLGVRPERLRVREGRTMTMEEIAEAFGEERAGARQRWSWRAGKLLAGLPRMEWQRGELARENARRLAKRQWEKRRGMGGKC